VFLYRRLQEYNISYGKKTHFFGLKRSLSLVVEGILFSIIASQNILTSELQYILKTILHRSLFSSCPPQCHRQNVLHLLALHTQGKKEKRSRQLVTFCATVVHSLTKEKQ